MASIYKIITPHQEHSNFQLTFRRQNKANSTLFYFPWGISNFIRSASFIARDL